jgi:cyclic pyranopterin phosphate synthase
MAPSRAKGLTHIDEAGRARMVDVSQKPATAREAVATGRVRMKPETLTLALGGGGKKGEVRAVAELAGVMAAKKTAELIPLCHPLALSKIAVEVSQTPDGSGLTVTARVASTGPTGVEMEALTAVSVACLTLYDMLKAADRTMSIDQVRLEEKTGGASGGFRREAP